jgi:hypothetical protein
MLRLLTPLCLALLVTAGPAAAQPPAGGPVTPPPMNAVRLTGPVTVDGRLDEAAWQGPPAATRLLQSDPVEGAAATESTWVWIAWDDEALYVAARMFDACPDSMIAQLVRRDVSTPSDRFMVFVDPFRDKRSGYYFAVNVAGVLYDGTLFNDGWDESSWDGVWEGRAQRGPDAWTCEIRVPFSQLRFRRGAEQVWGINFARRLGRRNEADYLVYPPKQASGFVSRFPELHGIRNGHHAPSLELLPYVTGKADYLAHAPGDPFNDGSRYTPGLGVDLRRSVGNSLTLNATVNPDFGQVEVDPAVVNLSDVETYFSEKRPFFTENARVFGFGNEGASDYWGFNWSEPTFFYTRRVGRAPQGRLPYDADFGDPSLATHILGAAKLTGKLRPDLNFGTMHAVTRRETGDYERDGLRSTMELEPLTYYGVARALNERPGGYNGLGAMTTLVQRRFDGDESEAVLNEQSLMAGLDGWHFLDRGKKWVLSGYAALSRVAGTRERMLAVQQGPLHYLQRPDATHLGVDSSATSLTGYVGRLWLNKQQGDFFSNSAVGVISPGFDVNDMGYQARADVVNAHSGAGYKWVKPNAWRKYAHVLAAGWGGWDFGGNLTSAGLYTSSHVNLANDYEIDASASFSPATVRNRLTRGGPRMLSRPGAGLDWTLATDARRPRVYTLSLGGGTTPATNSFSSYVGVAVEWKPVPNLSVQLGPEVDRNVDDAQYVATVAASGDVPADFGGCHYVFARLDQTTVLANVRLNVSFTPSLSLQTYLQPLISAGRYTDFKELARARSYDFIHYASPAEAPGAPGDPSFNFKSLRGNAVLRWEYRPGSVLYLVWTQERTDFEPDGELRFRPSTRRLLDAEANDVFMVKATYYLDL